MYSLLLIPMGVGLAAQLLKLTIEKWGNGDASAKELLTAYGGFPSVHSALVTSITTAIGIVDGPKSPLFATTFILSFLVIRDALGLRNVIYSHSSYLNKLASELHHRAMVHLPRYKGHTPAEIIGGIAFGLVMTLLIFKLITP